MGFLNFKNPFKKKRENSFHEQIQQEKKQKYLFRSNEETYVSHRKKIKKISNTSQSHSDTNHFARFFQKHFRNSDGERDLKHIMGAVGILLIILVGYIVIFSPYFKINPNKIIIEAQTQGIDTNTALRSVEGIYGESIFFIDEKSIANNLKENIQNIEKIRLTKLYPNGLKITLKSLPIQFDATIFGIENKRWGISSNGVLVPLANLKEENLVKHLELISSDLQSELFLNYRKILSEKEMFIIGKIFEVFAKEWSELKIANAKYFLIENELHISLESNTTIIFALHQEFDLSKQEVSTTLLNELLTLKTYIASNHKKFLEGNISYADVRIPGKVFICSATEQCQKNLINIYGNAYQK